MKHVVLIATLHAAMLTEAAAQQRCHPSYEGACVSIASDVDCAGGSGNGPEYVRWPVYVVSPNKYDLDRVDDGGPRVAAAAPTKRLDDLVVAALLLTPARSPQAGWLASRARARPC